MQGSKSGGVRLVWWLCVLISSKGCTLGCVDGSRDSFLMTSASYSAKRETVVILFFTVQIYDKNSFIYLLHILFLNKMSIQKLNNTNACTKHSEINKDNYCIIHNN